MKYLFDENYSIKERIREEFISIHLLLLKALFQNRPLPLSYWTLFRSIIKIFYGSNDPIFPSYFKLQSKGTFPKISLLHSLFRNDTLGKWSLDRESVVFFWETLQKEQPGTIIECGAGVSSLLLSAYAKNITLINKKRPITIISIEQSLENKRLIEKRLAAHDLDSYINVIHAPVSQGKYMIDSDEIWRKLNFRKVDWLIIDGPTGLAGCRVWTLPMFRDFCGKGAKWFLDDAFRDGELWAIKKWSKRRDITVKGIFPIGKGIATGTLK